VARRPGNAGDDERRRAGRGGIFGAVGNGVIGAGDQVIKRLAGIWAPLRHGLADEGQGRHQHACTPAVELLGDPERGKVLAQIAHKEPVPPRKINKLVPVDLKTICLKALDKEERRSRRGGHITRSSSRWQN